MQPRTAACALTAGSCIACQPTADMLRLDPGRRQHHVNTREVAAPHLTASGLWASFQTLLVMNSRWRLPCCISSCNPSPTSASLPYEAAGTMLVHISRGAKGKTNTVNSSRGSSTSSSVPVPCEGCKHNRACWQHTSSPCIIVTWCRH